MKFPVKSEISLKYHSEEVDAWREALRKRCEAIEALDDVSTPILHGQAKMAKEVLEWLK